MPIECGSVLGACTAFEKAGGSSSLSGYALMWKKLAAETEADGALLSVISDMQFGEPFEVLPLALGLLPRAA